MGVASLHLGCSERSVLIFQDTPSRADTARFAAASSDGLAVARRHQICVRSALGAALVPVAELLLSPVEEARERPRAGCNWI